MRLSWSEIRSRAAKFAEDHKEDAYEKGQTQTFYNDFFDVFGISRRQVATYERRVRNFTRDKQGFIDLFWPGTLIVEQKSFGLDLRKASNQALDYYDWLPEAERPRYILTCDFQTWDLIDLHEGREWRFRLADLKDNIEAFSFMVGLTPRLNRKQAPVNATASTLMGQLHGHCRRPASPVTTSNFCSSACCSSYSRTIPESSTTRISLRTFSNGALPTTAATWAAGLPNCLRYSIRPRTSGSRT
jgi:hypothetical protein